MILSWLVFTDNTRHTVLSSLICPDVNWYQICSDFSFVFSWCVCCGFRWGSRVQISTLSSLKEHRDCPHFGQNWALSEVMEFKCFCLTDYHLFDKFCKVLRIDICDEHYFSRLKGIIITPLCKCPKTVKILK